MDRRTDCHNQCAHWFRNDVVVTIDLPNSSINRNLSICSPIEFVGADAHIRPRDDVGVVPYKA